MKYHERDGRANANNIATHGKAALRQMTHVILRLREDARHDEADRMTALHDQLARELEAALRPVRVVS